MFAKTLKKELEMIKKNDQGMVPMSRKVLEETLRANYPLPNFLYDEIKRALRKDKK